jgi:NADH-ubiquinone oxidoreductase chain 2
MVLLTIFFLIIILSFNSINNNLNSSLFRRITAVSLLCAGVLSFNTFFIQSIGSGIGVYSGLFKVSILSNFVSLFLLIISSIILLIWPNISPMLNKYGISLEEYKENYNNISNKNKSKQYGLIILFNILGALLLITSSDLISMYLSIELQSFGLYILSTIYKEKLSSTSAGLKYFLLGGLSSCIILLGSGLVYTFTGLTNLELIYTLISIYFNSEVLDMNGIGIGFFLILTGFLFKIAAAPFHNWSIDVYDDTPTIVTVWLTVMPKISILIFLLQLLIGIDVYINILEFIPILPSVTHSPNILSNLLILSSLLSLIIGAIVGLSQIRIKRLLAYSTINHVGFLLLSLSVLTSSSSNFSQSIDSFIFYIVQYTITNLNIFLIILALSYIINKKIDIIYKNNTNINNKIKNRTALINISDIEYINSLKGLFYNNPVLSLSLSICLFSFAGVPPLIGFFAKQQVLYSSNSAGYFFISLVAILVSVISAFYYLKIIKIVFAMPYYQELTRDKENYNLNNDNSIDKIYINRAYTSLINTQLVSNIHSLLIGIFTLFIIVFILNPELLLNSIAIITSLIFNI